MKFHQGPYDDFVMDHIRNARNFRALEMVSRESTGSNPLCGDRITVQIHVVRRRIEAAAFQCECCGVSMASASMMTDWANGRTLAEIRRFAHEFIERLARRPDAGSIEGGQMECALLATIREFPARAGCAVLPWSTLESMLDGDEP